MPSTLNAVREALAATLKVPTPGADTLAWGDILNDDALQKLLNMVHGVAPVVGAAAATDANGNPTPDTVAFPPASYPEGTIFKATSYPAGVDGGGMEFRREGGVGAEAWVWRWGSYRASNSDGSYQRFADGEQICRVTNHPITTSASGLVTVVLPAAYATTGYDWSVDAYLLDYVAGCFGSSNTVSSMRVSVKNFDGTAAASVSTTITYTTTGKWKA